MGDGTGVGDGDYWKVMPRFYTITPRYNIYKIQPTEIKHIKNFQPEIELTRLKRSRVSRFKNTNIRKINVFNESSTPT